MIFNRFEWLRGDGFIGWFIIMIDSIIMVVEEGNFNVKFIFNSS